MSGVEWRESEKRNGVLVVRYDRWYVDGWLSGCVHLVGGNWRWTVGAVGKRKRFASGEESMPHHAQKACDNAARGLLVSALAGLHCDQLPPDWRIQAGWGVADRVPVVEVYTPADRAAGFAPGALATIDEAVTIACSIFAAVVRAREGRYVLTPIARADEHRADEHRTDEHRTEESS